MRRARRHEKRHMKTPDVIATGSKDVTLFEAQTNAAASWLSSRCQARIENPHDQIRVDRRDETRLIHDLEAAGFAVIRQRL